MSDIAVTWAKAQTCYSVLKGRNGKPDRQRVDRNAKQVLIHMASYADAAGEAWALVSVLAVEMEVEERTVERGRKALVEAGLLIRTGETKTYKGKVIPIFQLPVETGYASTVRRIAAERGAREAVDHSAWGDTGVAPDRGLGATPVSPVTDPGVTPWGDTGVALIGKEIIKGLTPCASAREIEVVRTVDDPHRAEAEAAWGRKAQPRVIPGMIDKSWPRALAVSGWTSERMAAAVTACVARNPDFERGKAVGLHKWLDERCYEVWDVTPEPADQAVRVVAWEGPAEVRQAVLAAMGQGGVVSYLDPAGWDETRRVVLAQTGHALDRLRDRVGKALADLGVGVERANG